MRDLMRLGLSRSTLAVAQLGFVSGLFVPGFSRNPCLEGELDVWVPSSPLPCCSSLSLGFYGFPTPGFFNP